jgi:archaellum biogenesis ATPase FlaH
MPKHTIELGEEEIRVVKVVKAVMDIKSIDKAISYIIKNYADSEAYSDFIKERRGLKK